MHLVRGDEGRPLAGWHPATMSGMQRRRSSIVLSPFVDKKKNEVVDFCTKPVAVEAHKEAVEVVAGCDKCTAADCASGCPMLGVAPRT